METTTFHIDEVTIPVERIGPGWDDFAAAVGVRNIVEAEAYQTAVLAHTAEELYPAWLTLEQSPMRLFVARAAGAIVARAVYETLADPASGFAWFTIDVLPAWRRIGIGGALMADRKSVV